MNNLLSEFASIEQMATVLKVPIKEVEMITKNALQYCKDKRISHFTRGNICGFSMITLLIRGKKTSNKLKSGYHLCYAYNVDAPALSELGDCVIDSKNTGFYSRVG